MYEDEKDPSEGLKLWFFVICLVLLISYPAISQHQANRRQGIFLSFSSFHYI